ncbi:MAG: ATP-binding protein, partial [Acidobacteriota bacterium]
TQGGDLRLVGWSASPIIRKGAVELIIISAADLTERRLLEQQLEQQRRIGSLGMVAARITHEFNNILMSIKPWAEIIARNTRPERHASAAAQIQRAVERGRSITNEILRFATPAPPEPRPLDLKLLLEEIVRALLPVVGPSITLELDHSQAPPLILGDHNEFQSLFTNLLFNARDAMPDGGRIQLQAEVCCQRTFAFGVVPDHGRFAHIRISDTGVGMTPEVLARVFEPLFTTKKAGTGLGLAIARQTVLKYGGHVFVESIPGAGTTFHLMLPIA